MYKAAFYEGNRTFSVKDVPPVSPGNHDVRIEVSYCGICGTDQHIFKGVMDARVGAPQVIGHEMSGVIVETGSAVNDLKIGDRVVVRPIDSCGDCPACKDGHGHICHNLNFIGIDSRGAFQNSWTVPAVVCHKLPSGLDMRLAAMIEPVSVACHDVRLGKIKAGEKVAVLGGGPIGMLVGLVAGSKGAEVYLSEINPQRLKLAKEFGFKTVNPAEEDAVKFFKRETAGAGVDAVFEVSSAKASAELMTEIVRTRGRIVIVGIYSDLTPVNLFKFFWRELKMIGARVYEAEDYEEAIRLAASGSLPLEKLITLEVPLAEIQTAFDELAGPSDNMKVIVKCGEN